MNFDHHRQTAEGIAHHLESDRQEAQRRNAERTQRLENAKATYQTAHLYNAKKEEFTKFQTQADYNKFYKFALGHHLKTGKEPTPHSDIDTVSKACKLTNGNIHKGAMEKAIATNSPDAARLSASDQKLYSQAVVAKGMEKYLENKPRQEQQNAKSAQKSLDHKAPSPSINTHDLAAVKQFRDRSR